MGCNGMPFFSSNFLLQTEDDGNQPSLLPSCSPQDFHVASFLGKTATSFSGQDHICGEDVMNREDDLSDDGLSHGGEIKKRRLNAEQVKTLEQTFEEGNKVEPERKMQLARALGLQPRQVAIWFQNRRARWKTKQLEKDYGILKSHFDAVKAENDSLISHNQKLLAEILSLSSNRDHQESINLNKETIIDQGSCSTRSDNSSDTQLEISVTPAKNSPSHDVTISFPLFPTSSSHHTAAAATAAQIFLSPSSRSDHQLMMTNSLRADHNTNINNHHQQVKEESLSNMFCGMEDQPGGLWPWLEQQHFN